MQVRECKVGGLLVKSNVPSSVEEYDSMSNKQGAALEAAVDYADYHIHRQYLRDGLESLVTEVHGIAPREIGTGVFEGEGEDKKEVTKTEKFEVYLNRVKAEKNLTDADLQSLADRLSAGGDKEITFDKSLTERERKAPRPAKLPAWATEQAKQFLATASDKAKAKFAAKAKEVTGVDLVIGEDTEANIKAFASAAVEIKRAANVFGS